MLFRSWIMKYIFSYGTTMEGVADFDGFIGSREPVLWHFLFMAITTGVCYFGIKGIERASKVMMPLLFALLLVIIVRSVTLPGAMEGIKFIFSPNFSAFSLNSISGALGQVFYSLSL